MAITVWQHNRIDRDVAMVEDVYEIIDIVPENTIISIQPEISRDWSLHGYLYRYAYISIDFEQKHDNDFLIVSKGYNGIIIKGYEKNKVTLNKYDLYKKKYK
jgi:hypothetical protein